MAGFDFFRERRSGYMPRTPQAILRAVGAGLASAEHFIHASCSVKPLDEEPFDLDAIERTLSRTGMGIETGKLLKGVLEKLIAAKEPETALFGAEGINTLEGRYVTRIERLKAEIAEREEGESLRLLARLYYELSELHLKTRSIRAFYLAEAYAALKKAFSQDHSMPKETLGLLTDVLIALGLPGQAARVLKRTRHPDDPSMLLLAARAAFHMRDFTTVTACCRELSSRASELREAEQRIVAFWLER